MIAMAACRGMQQLEIGPSTDTAAMDMLKMAKTMQSVLNEADSTGFLQTVRRNLPSQHARNTSQVYSAIKSVVISPVQ